MFHIVFPLTPQQVVVRSSTEKFLVVLEFDPGIVGDPIAFSNWVSITLASINGFPLPDIEGGKVGVIYGE